MGKETRIVCDACGKDIYHKEYVTVAVRKVIHGKQSLFPTIWLCPDCYRKTRLALVLADMMGIEKESEGENV